MKGPPPSLSPLAGSDSIRTPGFSYLPRFFDASEAEALASYFATLRPRWEKRHADDAPSRRGGTGSLTRPVYWLGAWQFAALGYYALPHHTDGKCVRAEPLPEVMLCLLRRLQPELAAHGDARLPNTCLINYYGHTPKGPGRPPVDMARLRMHRDGEPGPVVMLSVGQPAQFEFVAPGEATPHHAQWIRHRSVVVLSGSEYKDRLYHRVTRVRHGQQPKLEAHVDEFVVRRISVSFRHVPEADIADLGDLPPEAQAIARPHVEALAEHSPHFAAQLRTITIQP